MTDLVETSWYDEEKNKVVQRVTYDNSAVLAANQAQRNAAPETGRYKGNLVHVGRIHMGDVVRLRNEGYDLLSPDPDEVKRALLHIQSEEKALLTVPGNPISKKRLAWV